MAITSPVILQTPLSVGLGVEVTQAPGGTFSHDGDLYYGWDFVLSSGSIFGADVLAVADGTVVFIEESVPDGGPASGSFGDETTPRDPSLGPSGALGNVVTLYHNINGQEFYSSYFHLKQDSVPLQVGDTVLAGQVIGQVGNTGVRTDTHLHVNIGNTLGSYTNGTGDEFTHYQIAEGPGDGGTLLSLIDFEDTPNASGELAFGDTFISSSQIESIDLAPVKIGEEFQASIGAVSLQSSPKLVTFDDGGFLVGWRYATRFYAMDFDPSATKTIDSPKLIANSLFVTTPNWSLSGDNEGGYVYAYQYSRSWNSVSREIFIQNRNYDGEIISGFNADLPGEDLAPNIASISDGQFVLVWGNNGFIYGQIFDPDGLQSPLFQVGYGWGPIVESLSNGGFVVIWQSFGPDGDDWGIYGQRFDVNGTFDGVEFQVNTFTSGGQSNPSVSALTDGGFVVTWQSFGQDGDDYGIYGQRFSADGSPIGSEFQVNTYSASIQALPSIAALSDGGYVATWHSFGQDGDDYGIYGQRFSADGLPIGSEFQVNTNIAGSQSGAVVEGLSNGGFVVTWMSSYGSYGVAGQRFTTEVGNISSYQIEASAVSLSEGTELTFTVSRSGELPAETVYFSALAASASFEEGDYATLAGKKPLDIPVSFASGEDTQSVTLQILQDGSIDEGERFRAVLQRYPADPATTFLARSDYVTISEAVSTSVDTIAASTSTLAVLTDGLWETSTIDAEPLAQDSTVPDGTGGYVDKDWFSTSLARGALYTFSAEALSLSTGQVAIQLYDASGNVVSGTFAEGASPTITLDTAGQSAATATYFLAISAGDDNGKDFRLATGEYRVKVDALTDTASPVDTVKEGIDTTTKLLEGQWRVGTIDAEPIPGDGVETDGSGGFVDKDWYWVVLQQDRNYTFQAEDLGLSTGLVQLELRDASGNLVPGMSAEGASPQLTFSTAGQTGAQDYYLAISAGDTNDSDYLTATGGFRVRFEDAGPVNPNAPTGTDLEGNLVENLRLLADASYKKATIDSSTGFSALETLASSAEPWGLSINTNFGDLKNNSHFYEANVDGERTLFLAFSGTDPDNFLTDVLLQIGRWQELYNVHAPLIESVLQWADGAVGRGEQAFTQMVVTGHSLGGILVEEFFASGQFTYNDLARNAYGVTFGSPGSSAEAIDASRLINFINLGDPVAALDSENSYTGKLNQQAISAWHSFSIDRLLEVSGVNKLSSEFSEATKDALLDAATAYLPAREGTTISIFDKDKLTINPFDAGLRHDLSAFSGYRGTVRDLLQAYAAEDRSGFADLDHWAGQETGLFSVKELSGTDRFVLEIKSVYIDTLDILVNQPLRIFGSVQGAGIQIVQPVVDAAFRTITSVTDEIIQVATKTGDIIVGAAEALNDFVSTQKDNFEIL